MQKNKKGFTLIELIIVIALAGLIFTAAAAAFPLIASITGTADDITTAQTLAQTKLQMIQSQLRYASSLNIESAAPTSAKSGFNYIYLTSGKIMLQNDSGTVSALTSDAGFEEYSYTLLFTKVNSKVIKVTVKVLSGSKELFKLDAQLFVNNLLSESITGLSSGAAVSYELTGNPVTSILVTSSTSVIGIYGNKLQMSATVSPSNASKKGIAWSVDNMSLASITQTGMLTPLASGVVTVKATAMDGSAVYGTRQILIVTQVITITDVTLNTSSGSQMLQKYSSVTIVPTVKPGNASYQSLSWKVDNTDYATINSSGVLTAKGVSNKSVMVTATTTDGSNITASIEILLID